MSDRTKWFSIGHRNVLWMLALTITVALIFASSAMTQTKKAQQKVSAAKHEMVIITPGANPDDPPSVDKPSVTLYKNNGDDVEWDCVNPDKTHCDFIVVFTEPGKKPFNNRGFFKGKGKSGKITGAEDKYKYWVIVGGGFIDPDVIIKGS